MRLQSFAITRAGIGRDHNEDHHVRDDGMELYAVADGMGGHPAGEVASRLACAAVRLRRTSAAAHALAHLCILGSAKKNPDQRGMGCTLTTLRASSPGRLTVDHAGDSRCYMVRGGVGCQLTTDHKDGKYLANGVGGNLAFYRGHDSHEVAVRVGDVFLLCSDGIGDHVSADDLAAAVVSVRATQPKNAAELLAHNVLLLALSRGSTDDLTAVIVEVCN